MQLQIGTQGNLRDEDDHNPISKLAVRILRKLSPLMGVSEEVSDDGEGGSEDLDRDMPSRFDNLFGKNLARYSKRIGPVLARLSSTTPTESSSQASTRCRGNLRRVRGRWARECPRPMSGAGCAPIVRHRWDRAISPHRPQSCRCGVHARGQERGGALRRGAA